MLLKTLLPEYLGAKRWLDRTPSGVQYVAQGLWRLR